MRRIVVEALCAYGVRQRLERRDGRVESVDRERAEVDVVEVINRRGKLGEVGLRLCAVLTPPTHFTDG